MPADVAQAEYTTEDAHLDSRQKTSRRYIVPLYWAVIVLAVPFWWQSTSIIRHSIPERRVQEQSRHHILFPVNVAVEADSTVANAITSEFSSRVRGSPAKWESYNISFTDSKTHEASAYRIRQIPCDDSCTSGSPKISVSGRDLIYQTPSSISQDGVGRIADALEKLLLPPPSSVRAQFAPRYRLAFSLLNEDASMGGFALDWDIDQAINKYLRPTLDELSVLHNFTIESHVQYHAPLAFEIPPVTAEEGVAEFELDQDHLKTFVNSAEWTLSSSVNNDIVLHFVLFIPSVSHRPMYVLKSEGERASSNAFIVPQWGGITIWNPPFDASAPRINHHLNISELAPLFATFRSHLHTLLGVPSLPPQIRRSSTVLPSSDAIIGRPKGRNVLSPWQLDALLRRRILENYNGAQETLESIVKLINQIQNMPVKSNVREDVVGALDALQALCPYLPYQVLDGDCASVEEGSTRFTLEEALLHSSEASTKASRAFFSPDMLAMLYFPTEHTFAVYTPLFLPVAVPLIILTLKELAMWRRERNPSAAGATRASPPLLRLFAAIKAGLGGSRGEKIKTE